MTRFRPKILSLVTSLLNNKPINRNIVSNELEFEIMPLFEQVTEGLEGEFLNVGNVTNKVFFLFQMQNPAIYNKK